MTRYRRRSRARSALGTTGVVAALGLLFLASAGDFGTAGRTEENPTGRGAPNAEEPETCGATAPEVCVDDKPVCPAAFVCPEHVPGAVEDQSSSSVPTPVTATVVDPEVAAPETTAVAPPPPKPSSEAAPRPQAAEVPPETAPAEPAPAPEPETTVAAEPTGECPRTEKVTSYDVSWPKFAERLIVYTAELKAMNGATSNTPLIIGESWCAPMPERGGSDDNESPTTAPPQQDPPTTAAAPQQKTPQAPATTAPAAPRQTTTTTTTTTTTIAPTTAAPPAKSSPAPASVPRRPGDQRPTVPNSPTTTTQCGAC